VEREAVPATTRAVLGPTGFTRSTERAAADGEGDLKKTAAFFAKDNE
jgi:hypothetical protein